MALSLGTVANQHGDGRKVFPWQVVINREMFRGANCTGHWGRSSRGRTSARGRVDSEDPSARPAHDCVGNPSTWAHPSSLDLLFSRDNSPAPSHCDSAEPFVSASLLSVPARPSP